MPNACLPALFEAQVDRTPDAIAVTSVSGYLTYQELNARANRLAHHLRGLGVGPEVFVGICMNRTPDLVVAILGVLKAGGAYVPLEPAYPKDRFAFLLEAAMAPVLLTQQGLLAGLPPHEAYTLCMDTGWGQVAQEASANPETLITLDCLAYMIFTSGSTGEPKGVLIPHRGLVNYLTWCLEFYPVAEGSGAPVQSSIGFDLTITSLLTPLLAGRTVELLPEARGVNALSEAMRGHTDYSLVKITPAHLEVVGGQLDPEEAAGRTRSFIIGGEGLAAHHIAFWQRNAPQTILINEYGPTEATVGCCVYQAPAGQHREGPVPIGRPIANTELHVLDEHMTPVPEGAPGELYIGGMGLARGYHLRPALTAESFVPNPFSKTPGARLYRTGDLVQMLPDGNLVYLGRLDSQVKIRGYRIELEEIERVLGGHGGVRTAVVLAREDVPGDRRLVAYVVPEPRSNLVVSSLRGYLQERLPHYMVPALFIQLPELPLTTHGKVDRQALPRPSRADLGLEYEFVSPRTGVEAQLGKIWERVLEMSPVGVRDDFFEIGGDSLLAIRLIGEIQKAFGEILNPSSLLEERTIEGLAKRIARSGHSTPWASLVAMQPQGTLPPFFCVHAIGGEVLSFAELANLLGPNQPIYGLQARPQEQGRPPTPIPVMAAQYIAEVRSLQPHGPYYLGGFSFGGTVAFEMAQQLAAQGQEVALLAILDQRAFPARSGFQLKPGALLEYLRNIPRWLRDDLLHTSPWTLFFRLQRKVSSLAFRLFRLPGRRPAAALRGDVEALFETSRLPMSYRALLQHHFHAVLEYQPKAYPGRITLLRARAQSISRMEGSDLGWKELAGGELEVIRIPGTHDTLLRKPAVRNLAARLVACLRRAQNLTRPLGAAGLSSGPHPASSWKPLSGDHLDGNHIEKKDPVWKVVVNHEGQYSIWPLSRENPLGWREVGMSGSRAECLGAIKEAWSDLRPLSLRAWSAGLIAQDPQPAQPPPSPGEKRASEAFGPTTLII
jgi:amino acid adenylation domain-containing protein